LAIAILRLFGRGYRTYLKGIKMQTSINCLQSEEGMIPCGLLHDVGVKCYLTFCMDCGKDIVRDCEK